MPFHLFSRMFARDLAIDLGTANTLVYVQGEGIVLNEPSIVAVREPDQTVIAVGHEAKAMLGRTPTHIRAMRPLKDGVIADPDVAYKMLQHLMARVAGRPVLRPRVVVSVPYGITQVEKRAVRDAALQAGAREVYLVEEPVAAAIGAGLPVDEPGGNLILIIGGGTTEVAVISLSGIVHCVSLRTAGDEMDEAIIQYVRKQYNLLIGERQAEAVKLAVGSAWKTARPAAAAEVKGRDMIDGVPKTVTVSEEEIREALREPVARIVEIVRLCLERTPPELAADIVEKGLVLAGGGALLPGLDELLRRETNLPVTIADDPLTCTVRGAARVLEQLDLLRKITLAP